MPINTIEKISFDLIYCGEVIRGWLALREWLLMMILQRGMEGYLSRDIHNGAYARIARRGIQNQKGDTITAINGERGRNIDDLRKILCEWLLEGNEN